MKATHLPLAGNAAAFVLSKQVAAEARPKAPLMAIGRRRLLPVNRFGERDDLKSVLCMSLYPGVL